VTVRGEKKEKKFLNPGGNARGEKGGETARVIVKGVAGIKRLP